ncbi:hypothetical protein JZ751_004174 [Albula glossodonta]|uniref:Uncharacterized protein n=1 Tax=Albula glossodonta TaxID=121402 RepID=A0A8T2N5T5_9TELE|nr:hypothetical protein JZ751_004174 [Albula glossodonta]
MPFGPPSGWEMQDCGPLETAPNWMLLLMLNRLEELVLKTVRSYSNTRSLLMAGQMLYPTTLMLITLAPTGFFFLLCWSLFTNQHWEEISADPSQLGSSYWLGALGWVLLLAVLPVVFLVEQFVVPDPLPDLMLAAEAWWRAAVPPPYGSRSFSEGHCQNDQPFNREVVLRNCDLIGPEDMSEAAEPSDWLRGQASCCASKPRERPASVNLLRVLEVSSWQ